MTFRSIIARFLGEVTAAGLRVIGRQGTALPGLVATSIDPTYLRSATATLPSVLVSGTNGKTTTTTLLMRIVAASGRSVVLNGEGSNLARGIASTLISSPLDAATVGTFEVDEAELPNVADQLQPRTVILLNLFRDQMDRYGELDATARKWQTLDRLTNTELLVNVDDPNLGWFARQLRKEGVISSTVRDPDGISPSRRGRERRNDQRSTSVVTFGIESVIGEQTGRSIALHHTADAVLSPISHAPLTYRRVSFSHLGDYRDPKSSFKRPTLDYAITAVKLNGLEGSSFTIHDRNKRTLLSLATPLPGLFNVYNVAAAAIAAHRLGIDRPTIERTIASFHGAFGRFETIDLPTGGSITTLLVKNPVGFDQALALVRTMKHVDQVVLGLNDKIADGTDVSWIWDVDFELLADQIRSTSQVKRAIDTSEVERIQRVPIVTTGTRAHELANRLHYAGIPKKRLSTMSDLSELIDRLTRPKAGTTVACLTYTALLEFRRILAQRGLLAHQFAAAKDDKKSEIRNPKSETNSKSQ